MGDIQPPEFAELSLEVARLEIDWCYNFYFVAEPIIVIKTLLLLRMAEKKKRKKWGDEDMVSAMNAVEKKEMTIQQQQGSVYHVKRWMTE